jgi:hypothetical protein
LATERPNIRVLWLVTRVRDFWVDLLNRFPELA